MGPYTLNRAAPPATSRAAARHPAGYPDRAAAPIRVTRLRAAASAERARLQRHRLRPGPARPAGYGARSTGPAGGGYAPGRAPAGDYGRTPGPGPRGPGYGSYEQQRPAYPRSRTNSPATAPATVVPNTVKPDYVVTTRPAIRHSTAPGEYGYGQPRPAGYSSRGRRRGVPAA